MKPILLYDDRAFLDPVLSARAGTKRFGDIWLNGSKRHCRYQDLLLKTGIKAVKRAKNDAELVDALHNGCRNNQPVLYMSAQLGVTDKLEFISLIKRIILGGIALKDQRADAKLIYFPSDRLNKLIGRTGIRDDVTSYAENFDVFTTQKPYVDISVLTEFVSYLNIPTQPRSFNQIILDEDTIIKSSCDVQKIEAEFSFYNLVPDRMKPWFVQPFEFERVGPKAQYKMKRYLLTDCGFQFVNNAWSEPQFHNFLSAIGSFLSSRIEKKVKPDDALYHADRLFKHKVISRWATLEGDPRGQVLLKFVGASHNGQDILATKDKYLELYDKNRAQFQSNTLAIGHGDPCFSNILYDSTTQLLMLIDPKGATSASELYTHPLYDYCKLSHSLLGNYDSINNGKYEIKVAQGNTIDLVIKNKKQTLTRSNAKGFFGTNLNKVRIGEVSLFLSLIPLHLDDPKKCTAFLLNAKNILDEICKTDP